MANLVFDVENVEGFCREAKRAALEFGPLRRANSHAFANTKRIRGNLA